VAVEDPNVIDVVALNPKTDQVLLAMIETRPWGTRGTLLGQLQDKFSTYLTYALDGQLIRDYPDLKGKKIRIELRSQHPLGAFELRFMELVQEQYLKPEGIESGWSLISETLDS
jgi:hypothetical protein